MTASLADRYRPPVDGYAGVLVGRAWVPGNPGGPSVVVVREDGVYDITTSASTTSELFDRENPGAVVKELSGTRIGDVQSLIANSDERTRDTSKPWLLAPVDLQATKACGVTFAQSLLERVVEEKARGDASAADSIRSSIMAEIGSDLSRIKPGSEEADQLKKALQERGIWSQYLEVGIGPDPEVFTKAQPLSSVGFGATVGLHPKSAWNNPEPEIAVVVSSRGEIVGATLGNDVNLRDFEGRSALLLGKAKDNNASSSLGPFVRLFDETFGIDDVRKAEVTLVVEGEEGFRMEGRNPMSQISRDPTELVEALMGGYHQYPDGAVLYLGTMFAPTQDRGQAGAGFTHSIGDVVTIYSEKLGSLSNRVDHSDKCPPWNFGVRALIQNLNARGLLRTNQPA